MRRTLVSILIILSFTPVVSQVKTFMGQNGFFCFVNENGDTISKNTFPDFRNFWSKEYFAYANDTIYLMDLEGNYDKNFVFSKCKFIFHGKAVLKNMEGKYGAIDSLHKTIIPFEYDSAAEINEHIILFKKKEQLGKRRIENNVFDSGLNFLFKLECVYIYEEHGIGNEPYFISIDTSGKRICDKTGKFITDIYFDAIKLEKGWPWFIGAVNNKYGVMNLKGEILIPFEYANLDQSYDSVCALKRQLFLTETSDTTSAFININNKVVKNLDCQVIEFSETGIAVAKNVMTGSGRKAAYEYRNAVLSWNDHLLVPFKYEDIRMIEGTSLFLAGNYEYYDLYDNSGNLVANEKLSDVQMCDPYEIQNALLLYDKAGKSFIYNLKNGKTGNVKFESYSRIDFNSGGNENELPVLFNYFVNDKNGLMDAEGNKVVDAQYYSFEFLSASVFYASTYKGKKEKFFLFDLNKFSLPVLDFDEVLSADPKGNITVMRKNKSKKEYYEIKKDGRIYSLDNFSERY